MNDVTRNELVQAITIGRELAEELADAGRPIAGAVVRLLVEYANTPTGYPSAESVASVSAAAPAASAAVGHRHKWQFDAGLGYRICMADPDCKARPRKSKGAAEGAA